VGGTEIITVGDTSGVTVGKSCGKTRLGVGLGVTGAGSPRLQPAITKPTKTAITIDDGFRLNRRIGVLLFVPFHNIDFKL
jgi:hypothetical protein